MQNSLTGIKDLDREIMMKMDDRTLLRFCQTSQYANELCKNDIFWRNRTFLQYPRLIDEKLVGNRSWRKYYLYLTYWVGKLAEDYDYISGDFYGDPVDYHIILNIGKIYRIKDYPENRTAILDEMFRLASSSGYIDLLKYLAEEGAGDYDDALYIALNVNTIKTLIQLSKEYASSYNSEDYQRAIEHQRSSKDDIPNYLENIAYLESLL